METGSIGGGRSLFWAEKGHDNETVTVECRLMLGVFEYLSHD